MSDHLCHAHGCKRPVPPRMFMCLRHWKSLRQCTQAAIWREYRPGQENDKGPSKRYMAVQRFAVGEAAFKPHDDEAARVVAEYLFEAIQWQRLAVAAGEGDPLAGLGAPIEG